MSERSLPPLLEEVVPVDIFKAEVDVWARRMGVSYRELHLRPMKTKWANCSSRGRLTFDRALLRESAPRRAYVIAHELLHLRVPNHSRLFRALLRAHLKRAGVSTPTDM